MNRNPSIAPLSGLGRASASWMAIGLVAVSAIAQPSVTTDPKSQSVSLGAKVTLQVRANGTAPLSYQWRFQESDHRKCCRVFQVGRWPMI